MNNYFASLLFVTASVSATAQSVLRVSLTDNTPITVAVDGRYFGTRGTSVTVNDIPPGRHEIRIFVYEQNRNGKGVERTIYDGRIKTYRGHTTLFSYDPMSGRTVTSEEEFIAGNNNPQQGSSFNQHNLDKFDEAQPATPVASPQEGPVDTTPNYDTGLPPGTPLASPVASPVEPDPIKKTTKPVKADKMKKLKAKADAKVTDTEKMEEVTAGLKNVSLTTDRVMEIMSWFRFESTRVDFAKWAYSKTTDVAHYKKIRTKLTNDNNKRDFDSFLKTKS